MVRALVLTNMYPRREAPTEGVFVAEQVESLRRAGVEVHLLRAERTTRGPRAYLDVAARTRREVAAVRPDVVHAMYGGLLALQAARGAGEVPLVISFCGSDLLGDRDVSATARLMALVGVRASHRAARRAEAVIVKSEALARALPADLAPHRVHVVPNGVDMALFHPQDQETCRSLLGWTDPGPHVVFGAQPRPVKRPELARAAVEDLRRTHPSARLHIPDQVERDQMPRWLNAADVVVLTSRHEGSPNVVKEALACGARMVSVPVGDVPHRLHGLAGSAVVEDTPAAIADGLRAVLSAPRPGRPAASIAGLTLDAQAARIASLYRQILAPAPSAGTEPVRDAIEGGARGT